MGAPHTPIWRRGLVGLHWTVLAVVWGDLTVRAFSNLQLDYDFFAYHLPFALMHVGRTSYRPLPHLMVVYEGFPPLAEWIQGLLVVSTGRLSAACGIGMLGLAVALASVWLVRRPGFSLRWYLTTLLSVPLVVTHSGSGYADLFGASALVMAFAGVDAIFERRCDWRALGSVELGLATASCTKFTLWPFCFVIAAAAWIALGRRWAAGELDRRRWLAHTVVILAVVCAFPLRNVIRFGNPTYPWQPPLIKQTLPGFFTRGAEKVSVPRYLHDSAPPRRFVESALELNRLRTDAPFRWEVDQGRFQHDAPHFRMGGWFFVTVCGLAVFLVVAAVYDPASRPALALFAAIVVVLLGLPGNNELRYWLFVPMAGLYLVVKALPRMPIVLRVSARALFSTAAVYVVSQTAWVFNGRFVSAEELVPAKAREYWQQHQGEPPTATWVCIDGVQPATIFWAGPTLTEYRVQACR